MVKINLKSWASWMCRTGAWWPAAPSALSTSTAQLHFMNSSEHLYSYFGSNPIFTSLRAWKRMNGWIIKNKAVISMSILKRQRGNQNEQPERLGGTVSASLYSAGYLPTCHRELSAAQQNSSKSQPPVKQFTKTLATLQSFLSSNWSVHWENEVSHSNIVLYCQPLHSTKWCS